MPQEITTTDQPFFVLEDVIRAAKWAASEARKRAGEHPEDAARHLERAAWYDLRAKEWEAEDA